MTLDELWQLFPIMLTEHNDGWAEQYECMKTSLHLIIPDTVLFRISHIGSTAVHGIFAKPIIDILVELMPQSGVDIVKLRLTESGWTCMSESDNRMSFNLGYTEQGFSDEVFHLHLRQRGDNDELYFRDYLLAHADVAKEYESLKLALAERYRNNRDAYTDAKSGFVRKYTDLAKQDYHHRYD